MTEKPDLLSNFKLVCRRSRLSTKLVVLAAIVLSIATLMTLQTFILDAQARTDKLRQAAADLENANAKLEQRIQELGTIQGILNIAKEELGMMEKDSIVFDIE